MANLASLPFDVHILIARKLNLVDALNYAAVLPVCHDAVYYVFAHRFELDFSSTLNSKGVISLDDNTLMMVLHAHSRAHQIRYLSISPNFEQLTELKFYLDLYWQYTFIPSYEDEFLEPTILTGTYVGHPSGHLFQVGYTSSNNDEVTSLLHKYEDPVYGISIESEPLFAPDSEPLLQDDDNWSCTDLDEPYNKCETCDTLIDVDLSGMQKPNQCYQCLFIRDFCKPDSPS